MAGGLCELAGLALVVLGIKRDRERARELIEAEPEPLPERTYSAPDKTPTRPLASLCEELRKRLSAVRYLDLSDAIAFAQAQPEAWAVGMAERFDVVVIDPLSAVAAVLAADFDKSNAEYVEFHARLVKPLKQRGPAVLLLDNVGHALEARDRAKGASAKQDVTDLRFACKAVAQPEGLLVTARKVRQVRAPFKKGDSWLFDRETLRVAPHGGAEPGEAGEHGAFRPTVLMERVSRAIEDDPGLAQRALRTAVKGKHEAKDLAPGAAGGRGVRRGAEGRPMGAPLLRQALPRRRWSPGGPRTVAAARIAPGRLPLAVAG